MTTRIEQEADVEKFVLVGDRVLIRPTSASEKTQSGLYLPPNVQTKQKVQSGYVIKTGPGYPIPMPVEDPDESWKGNEEQVKYIPLQAQEGDMAIYLKDNAFDIEFQKEKYVIVPNTAVLMLVRDPGLFE